MFDSFGARVEMHEVGSSVGLVCCSTMQYVGTAGANGNIVLQVQVKITKKK